MKMRLSHYTSTDSFSVSTKARTIVANARSMTRRGWVRTELLPMKRRRLLLQSLVLNKKTETSTSPLGPG